MNKKAYYCVSEYGMIVIVIFISLSVTLVDLCVCNNKIMQT